MATPELDAPLAKLLDWPAEEDVGRLEEPVEVEPAADVPVDAEDEAPRDDVPASEEEPALPDVRELLLPAVPEDDAAPEEEEEEEDASPEVEQAEPAPTMMHPTRNHRPTNASFTLLRCKLSKGPPQGLMQPSLGPSGTPVQREDETPSGMVTALRLLPLRPKSGVECDLRGQTLPTPQRLPPGWTPHSGDRAGSYKHPIPGGWLPRSPRARLAQQRCGDER